MPPQVREPGVHPALPAQPRAARPAWPGWGGRRAIGCSLHGTHLTGTRRPASPAVGAASWAGCSVPQPCPCPCPTLRPGDARWPEGTRSTEALLFLPHEMGVEEKTPEATFRRTKGQYITFGLTFLWLWRRGEGSTCGAGALHGSTLRKHSQTKAARPHSPAARRVSMAGTARGSQLPSGAAPAGTAQSQPVSVGTAWTNNAEWLRQARGSVVSPAPPAAPGQRLGQGQLHCRDTSGRWISSCSAQCSTVVTSASRQPFKDALSPRPCCAVAVCPKAR